MRPLAAPTAAWSASANPQPLAGVAQAAILTNFALRRERPGLAPPAPRNAQKPRAPRPVPPPPPRFAPNRLSPPPGGGFKPRADQGARFGERNAPGSQKGGDRRRKKANSGARRAGNARTQGTPENTRRGAAGRKRQPPPKRAADRTDGEGNKNESGAQQKRRSEDRLFSSKPRSARRITCASPSC